jgi:hypothetical protein
METNECMICIEEFNRAQRKKITCPQCVSSFCSTCVETYILNSINDPDCMNCHKIWDNEFIMDNMTKVFVNTKLKSHRENILFEKEKSLLPSSQIHYEVAKKTKELQKEIGVNQIIIERIKQDYIKSISVYQDKITKCNAEIYKVLNLSKCKSTEKKVFIRACPAPDCRGFLSTSWQCGVCNIYVCSDCKEIKGLTEETIHTCDRDILASAKAIEKDSKPCPNCSALISKISGCSQMFCVQCNTTFDWNTHKIVTSGPLHNPHYIEWVRRTGGNVREQGDVPCGGLPLLSNFLTRLNYIANYKELRDNIVEAYRGINHTIGDTIPRYPVDANVINNLDLRIKYLGNEISEDEFKRQIQLREKKYRKNIAIRQVIDTLVTVSTESIRNINDVLRIKPTEQEITIVKDNFKNIKEIILYSDECLDKIGDKFICKPPKIVNDFGKIFKPIT